jgi:hypothetical protein
MFESHCEIQSEVIYYKLMSNIHYCRFLLNIDNICLKITFSIQSSFHFSNHDPLISCCDYNFDEKFVFS